MRHKHQYGSFELVKEAKVFDILGGRLDPRLEASGVLARDGLLYIIFDNIPHIACVGPELSPAAANHVIEQDRGHRQGFEDITYDPLSGRFYVLIGALPRSRAKFMAAVQEYDVNFGYLGTAWLDFPLNRPTKGLEGLACMHRKGQTYLLGLCRRQQVPGRGSGLRPRRRADSGVPARPPQLETREHDPAARNSTLRELQQYRRDRRPDRGHIADVFGPVARPPRAGQLGGHKGRHDLSLAEGRRWQHRLRDGRGHVMDGTGPGGHGLGQSQARTGPSMAGKGSVDPCLPHPRSGGQIAIEHDGVHQRDRQISDRRELV